MTDNAPASIQSTDSIVPDDGLSQEIAYLKELQQKPLPSRLKGYIGLSGPGWLQSALTLGGGSLSGSLFLGVTCGMTMLWLQPFAMILGIIMLSAVGYVTLSTGRRPFRDLNTHITPLLGWTWLLASLMANIVWSMPQYTLAMSVMRKNLLPSVFGTGAPLGGDSGTVIMILVMLALAITVTWSYGSGHWGVRLYELMLKIIVGLIVLCFIFVVFQLMFIQKGFDWSGFFGGFIPNFSALFRPTDSFLALIDKVPEASQQIWKDYIAGEQRDRMMTAFATAVGVNMMFLLPYSMIGRGWRKEHRGLAIFDLSTGMLIPFLLATTCIVVASASAFHNQEQHGLVRPIEEGSNQKPANAKQVKGYKKILSTIAKMELVKSKGEKTVAAWNKEQLSKNIAVQIGKMGDDEKMIAATLVPRDVDALATALEPAFGNKKISHIIFGLGVLGMTLSTISLLMLVTGFVVCEVLDVPPTGWTFRIGCLLAAIAIIGPIYMPDASIQLFKPTSVFGLALLPIAYLAFFLMMNQKQLLGGAMPTGGTRFIVNILMGIATLVAMFGSLWAINAKLGIKGVLGFFIFLLLVLISYLLNPNRRQPISET